MFKRFFGILLASSLLTCNVNVKAIPIATVATVTVCLAAAGITTIVAIQKLGFLSNIGGYSPARFTEETFVGLQRNFSDIGEYLTKAAASISNGT